MKNILIYGMGMILMIYLVNALSISKIATNVTIDSGCGDGLWGNFATYNNSRTVNNVSTNSTLSILTSPNACLIAYNYNFSIPIGSTITGVQADSVVKGNRTGVLSDSHSTIYVDDGFGTPIQSSCLNDANGVFLGTSYASYTYGGDGFNWACSSNTLDVTTVNSDGFGYGIAYQITSGSARVSVDSINMTIYYTTQSSVCTNGQACTISCGQNYSNQNNNLNNKLYFNGTGTTYLTNFTLTNVTGISFNNSICSIILNTSSLRST